MRVKMVTIVGARPQFIKAAPVSALIRKKFKNRIREILVHTGQHYDRNMSEIFFRQMRIPRPKYHLGIGGGAHGAMTGRMLEKIEKVLQKEKPDVVLVYGDTNSTLAGALAAAKVHIPVAHVEAGLRSYNMKMPEEINRIVADHISSLLFCPTQTAVKNLKKEGVTKGIVLSGDVMFDAAKFYLPIAKKLSLKTWGLSQKKYVFCTVHRQENIDDIKNLQEILKALEKISRHTAVVFAIHPRTKNVIRKNPILTRLLTRKGLKPVFRCLKKTKGETKHRGFIFLDPLGYLETQRLIMGAKVVLTDSGGLQKEAFFHRIPCITLRTETEWMETMKNGSNQVTGADSLKISKAYKAAKIMKISSRQIGYMGKSVLAILNALAKYK